MDYDDDDENTTGIAIPVPVVPDANGKAAYLMVIGTGAPDNAGRMFKLGGPEMTLGRGVGADLRIEDDGISRNHARFDALGPARYRVTDLGSRNGTFVNGERVTSAELKDGDKVQVGSTTVLLFALQDELEEKFTLRMFEAATHDGMTRLFNKKYLLSALDQELSFATRYKAPLSLMMIDVDHFKQINDTRGHPAGDQVLIRLAERLTQLIRNEDVLARYGGEEFVSLLRQADERSAQVCGERCRAGIEGMRVMIGQQLIPVTISVGIATLNPGLSSTRDALIGLADANLYRAKNEGRNRVVTSSFASPDSTPW